MPRSRWSAVLVALVLSIVGWSVAPAAAQVFDRAALPQPDAVTVSGYNFEADRVADVVAGDQDSAVRIVFVAGRPLTDGTVSLLLPRAWWPTTLRTVPGFYGDYPSSPSDRAAVSVLPAENLPLAGVSCSGRGPQGSVLLSDQSIEAYPGVQTVTIRHATCVSGGRLVVRIKGVSTPNRVGIAAVGALTVAPTGSVRVTAGVIRIVPVPKVRLAVHILDPVVAGSTFRVAITRTGPAAAVARYAGAVALVSEPEDCTLTPRSGGLAVQFTPAGPDTREATASLDQLTAHRLRAYDVSNRALDGISDYFSVLPGKSTPICPASFH